MHIGICPSRTSTSTRGEEFAAHNRSQEVGASAPTFQPPPPNCHAEWSRPTLFLPSAPADGRPGQSRNPYHAFKTLRSAARVSAHGHLSSPLPLLNPGTDGKLPPSGHKQASLVCGGRGG